jgi:hypothetical protein
VIGREWFILSVCGMDILKRRASIKGILLNSAHEEAQLRMEARAVNENSREKTDAASSY